MIDMRTPGQDCCTATYRYNGDQIVCTLVDYQQDLEAHVWIDKEIIPLMGWPTEGMRAALDDDGKPSGEYYGCDVEGNIDPLTDGFFVAVVGEWEIAFGRTEEECIEEATQQLAAGGLEPNFKVQEIIGNGSSRKYRDVRYMGDSIITEDTED